MSPPFKVEISYHKLHKLNHYLGVKNCNISFLKIVNIKFNILGYPFLHEKWDQQRAPKSLVAGAN